MYCSGRVLCRPYLQLRQSDMVCTPALPGTVQPACGQQPHQVVISHIQLLQQELQKKCNKDVDWTAAGLLAGIMQGYFLKLLGNYRSHIYPDGCGPVVVPGGGMGGGVGGTSPHPPPSPHSGRSTPGPRDDAISGSGYWFDQAGLVAQHRWGC